MLGEAVAAALPALRAQAESMMTGTCDIHRKATTWDESEQKSVTTYAPVHLGVPCAFEVPPVTTRSGLADETVTAQAPQVKIPVAFDGIEPDDRVTVAGVGVVWVTHSPVRTNQVQRRLECRWVR